MNKELILEKIEQIVYIYTNGEKTDPYIDLMAKPVSLPPHDMAALFLDIEKEFSVDLNKLVPYLEVYSKNKIVERIADLYE